MKERPARPFLTSTPSARSRFACSLYGKRCGREHDASARAEHTMPREVGLFWGHLERETGQPCAAGQAGGACNRSIC